MNESDRLKIAENKERLLIQVSYPQALLERFRRVMLPAVSPWSSGNGSPMAEETTETAERLSRDLQIGSSRHTPYSCLFSCRQCTISTKWRM